MEKPITFKVNRQQVVGMLHLPDGAPARVPAVVLFHGFRGNKVEAHRIFVKAARTLCAAGFAALRVDFRGSGDSEGDFSKMTVSGELKDARAALRFVRRRREVDPARVGVMGLSLGGMIAAHILGEDQELKAGVLWSPVADPRAAAARESSPESDRELAQSGLFDMDGWAVGQAFVRELVTLDPAAAIVKTAAAILLVQGEEDERVPLADTLAYESALAQAGRKVARVLVPGAGHTYESLQWEMEAISHTLEWFRQHL